MLEEEKEQFRHMMKEMLAEQTKQIFLRIDKTDATLAPIAAIYDQASGAGAVAKFIFKGVVIPVSIILGIIVTIKEVVMGHIYIK